MSFLTGKGICSFVDHHVKKIYVYIFTRTVRKDLNAISDKHET